jgi:CubicO group peptidase (beta-lactamase class C family)
MNIRFASYTPRIQLPGFVSRLLILCFVTVTLAACSDSNGDFIPPSVLVNYDDPELTERLEAAFDTWVDDGQLVGASVQVHSPGRLDWSRSRGLVLVDEDTPFNNDSPVRVGSVTKPVTALVTLQLVEEGLLTLDTPLSDFLDYPNGDQITVEHLLRHRSGIFDVTLRDTSYIFSVMLNDSVWITPQEILDWTYGDEPVVTFSGEEIPREPVGEPGELFHYSQPGYVALGYMIEAVTQQSIADVFQERIFGHLGMDNTWMPEEDDPHDPVTYTNAFGLIPNQLPSNLIIPSLNSLTSSAWTAGGLVSTSADLVKLIPAITDSYFLTDESFQLMTDWIPTDWEQVGNNNQYGLGLFNRTLADLTTIGHGGSVPGSGAHMTYIEEYDLYITSARNSDWMASGEGSSTDLIERIRRAMVNEPLD